MASCVGLQVLHYFLADDTIEVHEIRARNSGRNDVATLISRQKIPKIVEHVPVHGQVAKRTMLNVFGNAVHGYFLKDQLGVGEHVM